MKNIGFLGLSLLLSCADVDTQQRLPIMGNHDYGANDTIFHRVADFLLVNQDSTIVTNETLRNKIYVSDFFFTTCPTICPIMKAQMLRIYDVIKDDPEVALLSHTIDPAHDTVAVLKNYAQNLGVKAPKWHFVTGERDEIYELAKSYMVLADEDPNAPGGFVHSGAFLLIDKEGRVRGVYDGTIAQEVDLLIQDIDLLKDEYEK